MAGRLLRIYLQDHLAGATGGAALAQRLARNNQGTSYAADTTQLAREITEDRATLLQLMAGLEVPPSRVKMAGAAFGERFGRSKLNGRLLDYSPLSRLLEIEALQGGVTGKAALWRALLVVADCEPTLDADRLTGLLRRATSQLDRLTTLHRRAAEDALKGGD